MKELKKALKKTRKKTRKIISTIIIICFVITIPLAILRAQDDEEESFNFKKSLRKYLVKIEEVIGIPFTDRLLGKDPDEVKLPEIPEIVINSKEVVNQKEKINVVKISKEDKEKVDYHFVNEIYLATVKRSPNDEELAKWINTLAQGASREGIYRAIVLGTEYIELEKYRDPPNPIAVTFARYYMEKFLNLHLADKSASEFNLFSIKRFVVEKTLEIVDTFIKMPDQDLLNNWYAVLSSELSERNPNIWNSDLRKDTSKKRHKEWAKQAPYDFIKSELIIKLHRVFNSLN
ncbi:MAG: DUF4214 domain-containing protein [Oligoflexia bacterium]|nr:DUF4214 domain-containing protein [Oligoflexia bacterium]